VADFSMQRRYPMLRFREGVDWRHIKLALLDRLNQLGAQTHHVIWIFSGYRSDKTSQRVGGFAGDPHTHGIAVDARVDSSNGKMIGSFYSPRVLGRYGLRSGNQPNFYQGKPDPEHVDLIGFGYDKNGVESGAMAQHPYGSQAAAALPAPVGTLPPQIQQTQAPPQTGPSPDLTTTTPMLPGTVAGDQSPVGAGSYWKRVLDQPSVSPDTQAYAGMFQ
jgi:hypothetical protein